MLRLFKGERMKEIKIDVVLGVEGKSLYIDDYRVSGSKPLGGGKVIYSFSINIKELRNAIPELKEEEKPPMAWIDYKKWLKEELEMVEKEFPNIN